MKDMKMICDTLLTYDFAQRINMGRGFVVCLKHLYESIGRNEETSLLDILGALLIAAELDGTISDKETEYVSSILGVKFSKSELSSLYSTLYLQNAESILETLSTRAEEWKNVFMMLILLTCVADGEISQTEFNFISKYFA